MKKLICVVSLALSFLAACQQDAKNTTTKVASNPDHKQESTGSILISAPVHYVGRDACSSCHKSQSKKWASSHHDLAMQVANKETVLGDFGDATFSHFGITSTFFKKAGKYYVNTDGPGGILADFEVKYTFGADPLQQYLIEFPGGRLQALSIAWDSRSKSQGGQRWFHLYPSENMDHTNPLHWTGVNQNWNYMCAECHSTNLKKNYDSTTNSYKTNWSEIDVSCEACHGPASKHVEWANSEYSQSPSQNYSKELVVSFAEPEKDIWHFVSGKKTAQRTSPLDSRVQEEICARCHSRRGVIHNEYQHEAPFLDSYRLSLLEESLYHSDGQINDEVYVYGSFLQSKMHQAGVVCSDCHDPHSLKLKAEGNDLCTKCHSAIFFDQPSHHHHNVDSLGSKCVSCHMPAKEYMVVDPRRDHSFRIPRPDFSVSMGTPNACNQCHDDKTLKWSMDVVMEWFGGEVFNRNHFGESLHAGRLGLPKAAESLIRLAEDSNQPAIARASSIDLLSRFPSQSTADSIKKVLQDPDPLVRIAATNSLEMIHPSQRFELAESLLFDSVRAVRIEAGRVLSPVPRMELSEKQKSLLGKAIDEYIEAQKVNADHPSAHLNLGVLYSGLRNWSKAETEYKTSIKLDSSFVQGYINLADLYRLQGREGEGEEILRSGLEIIKDSPEILHSLGLLLVRNKRMSVAIKALEKAANLRRENPRFSFVYAVALNSIGQNEKALEFLQKAQKNHPYNRDILFTLVTINRDIGHLDSALKYVRRLIELEPKNSRFLSLEEKLQALKN